MTTDELLEHIRAIVAVGSEGYDADDLPPVEGDSDEERARHAILDWQRAKTLEAAARMLRQAAEERAARVLAGRRFRLAGMVYGYRESRRYKLDNLDGLLELIPTDAVPQVFRLSGDTLRRKTLQALLDAVGYDEHNLEGLLAEVGHYEYGDPRLSAVPVEKAPAYVQQAEEGTFI